MAIFLNILFVYLVLRSSNWIAKKLGPGGANILRKVFGIILLAIAKEEQLRQRLKVIWLLVDSLTVLQLKSFY